MELALSFQVLLFLGALGIFLASGQASLFHPGSLYLLFHFLAFVLRPLLVHFLEFDSIWNYIGIHPSPADLVQTLLVSSVSLLVFMAACLTAGWAPVSYGPERDWCLTPLQKRALRVTTLLFIPLVVYSIYVTRNGVQGERAANGVYIMTKSTGYVNDAQWVIAPLLCAWIMATRFHWANLFPVVLYIAYRAWFGWSRFTIVLFFMSLVVFYCWHRRFKWPPAWSFLACLPILVVFNILGHNRDYLKTTLTGVKAQVREEQAGLSRFDKIRGRTDTQDFANFDYLTFILAVVPKRTGDYTYGLQYLQLFTEPIPRLLWKGKPTGAPVRTKVNIGAYGNFVGLTVSLPGDGWISGGWIGLVITVGLAGTALGVYHRYFWRHVSDPIAVIFYLAALPMFIQWFRDGGISIAKFLMWTWLPLLVWTGIIWVLGARYVPGPSVVFRRSDRLRLVYPSALASEAEAPLVPKD